MLAKTTEIISYTTASKMAQVFDRNTKEIAACMDRIAELSNELSATLNDTRNRFGVGFRNRHRDIASESIPGLFKLFAWELIIDHVGIRKIMSSKRQKELNDIIYSENPEKANLLPELDEDTIIAVLEGYASSADEFLNESIREEYDWLRPSHMERYKDDYKTNQKNYSKLARKIILEYAVENYYGGKRWSVGQRTEPHLQAIDNIFHLLDGQGMSKGHCGPLVDSIRVCDGSGETSYFSFRVFQNGNLHLTFKRQDLLDKFNQICGRNYIGQSA